MNTRNATVALLVTLLTAAAGCARPDVVPAATAPRPVVAYSVPAARPAPGRTTRLARYEEVPARDAHVTFEEPHRH